MLKKEVSKWRVCDDFRGLNCVTRPDRYSVPNILEFNSQLAGARIFTTLDIERTYHQIPVASAYIEKIATFTPFDLFEWTVMPFGLRNAAQSFQGFLGGIFRDLDFSYVYLDDILIASHNRQTHEKHVHAILKRLKQAGPRLNTSKFQYNQEKVIFLVIKSIIWA